MVMGMLVIVIGFMVMAMMVMVMVLLVVMGPLAGTVAQLLEER